MDEIELGEGASLEDTASPSEPPVEVPEPYSNQFFNSEHWINTVPEEHRGIVQKYAKDVFSKWDAGVNEALEKRAKEIKRYQELGEYEQLQAANQLYNGFRTNGDAVLGGMLKKYFEYYGPEALNRLKQSAGYSVEQEPQEQEWDYSQGEPDPRDIQIQNMQQQLEEFNTWKQEQEAARQEAELNKQLDGYLSQLHTARPDIPQDFLVQGLAAGQMPENIIKFYDTLVQNISSQGPRKNPPVVMGGQGGVPSGQVDVSKLNKEQRLAYMVQRLEADSA